MNKEIKAKDGVASVQTSGFNDVTKRKLLDDTLARINKQYGTGAIMVMGEEQNLDIESFSTGSILLDQAIGCHGVPKGRVIEVFGPESSGKTTIALQIIAEAQKSGGVAAFIDAEHALDLHYAKKIRY